MFVGPPASSPRPPGLTVQMRPCPHSPIGRDMQRLAEPGPRRPPPSPPRISAWNVAAIGEIKTPPQRISDPPPLRRLQDDLDEAGAMELADRYDRRGCDSPCSSVESGSQIGQGSPSVRCIEQSNRTTTKLSPLPLSPSYPQPPPTSPTPLISLGGGGGGGGGLRLVHRFRPPLAFITIPLAPFDQFCLSPLPSPRDTSLLPISISPVPHTAKELPSCY